MSDPTGGDRRVPPAVLLAIGSLSAAILMIELTLTRVFSVTMLYHFAFLAISIAMFGLSAGSVFVYVTPATSSSRPGVGKQLQVYGAIFWLVTMVSAIVLLRMRVRLDYSAANAASPDRGLPAGGRAIHGRRRGPRAG